MEWRRKVIRILRISKYFRLHLQSVQLLYCLSDLLEVKSVRNPTLSYFLDRYNRRKT